MKHRSIGQRLKRAGTPEAKKKTVLDWVDNWKDEHDYLIRQLERAVRTQDVDALASVTGQLKVVGEKKFAALPGVLTGLLDFTPTNSVESVD